MSVRVEMIVCSACEISVWASPLLPCVYLFPSGEQLSTRQVHGWCDDCSRVRQVEALPRLEVLVADEQALLKRAREKPVGLSRYEQRELEEVGLYRRLLQQRQSPPRCLECGGVAIQAWQFDDDGRATSSPHGGCPGLCKMIEDPDGMRIALIDDAETYSPEGQYLGRLSDQNGSGYEARSEA